eukprot:gene10135-13634_t
MLHRIFQRSALPTINKNFSPISSLISARLPVSTSLSSLPILNPFQIILRTMANYRHKKIIKLAKGYRGRANRCFTVALPRVMKARQYAYRDRKVQKREIKSLWIVRINAASRMYGLPYSHLTNKLQKSKIILNRKILADLAFNEPLSFKAVVEVAKLI